jgi:hypothetical protein
VGVRSLSIINAFYKNPGQLQRQFEHLGRFPDELKAQLQYLVCDDASPKGFRAAPPPAPTGLPVELFRLKKKVPWNWIAARNVCAAHATGDWLLFTDMDHMVPEDTARRLIEGPLDKRCVYSFARVDAPDLTPYKPHPNSWAMSRKTFDRFGGFDERFSGSYGSDGTVRNRLYQTAFDQGGEVVQLDAPLIRVPREVVPDASTTDFGRKGSEFNAKVAAIREEINRVGGPPKTMSFSYIRVA